MATLRTNYADDVFTGNRKYTLTENGDDTVSLTDVTPYSVEGDTFGASDINATNTEINSQGTDIATLQTQIVSTTKSYTLSSASWSNAQYTISDSLITATSNQEVLPGLNITAEQMEALSGAIIVDGGQSAGSLILKALGDVPTVDVPIRVIYRGVK